MTSVLILSFIAGFFAAGAIAHYTSGLKGKAYPMMMSGMPESPAVSIVWGLFLGVVAVVLWHLAPMRFHARAASLGALLGLLVAGLLMSGMATKSPRHRKEP